ncbi:uncharacterized protein CIMG_02741 [Coccidioides immitis RS]|uniref:RING-type domain-containing protein n=2 Tax=Coccidioides immitis TaxID=5501 RepID=J3KM07_COCIM|nr:uncharacterized protein CIMG_02741 [Coccidioides immitis RS]EAS37387.3 hypothetical protein CIMG_02741 [Coccidioides immitis RS]KMU77084.1 hypothetical protein CISG_06122 [Coccidioides immitis RMSCC 3703]
MPFSCTVSAPEYATAMESTDCSICLRPFYLPFRWGDACNHTFCLECLWGHLISVDYNSNETPITACPYCREREYNFTYDEVMETYMKNHGILHDRSLMERQTLHLKFINFCLAAVNDAMVAYELDDESNNVITSEGDGSNATTSGDFLVIPADVLAELDELANTPQVRYDPASDEEDQKINALLALRDHLPIRKLRLYGQLHGVHFQNEMMHATLEASFPLYEQW